MEMLAVTPSSCAYFWIWRWGVPNKAHKQEWRRGGSSKENQGKGSGVEVGGQVGCVLGRQKKQLSNLHVKPRKGIFTVITSVNRGAVVLNG